MGAPTDICNFENCNFCKETYSFNNINSTKLNLICLINLIKRILNKGIVLSCWSNIVGNIQSVKCKSSFIMTLWQAHTHTQQLLQETEMDGANSFGLTNLGNSAVQTRWRKLDSSKRVDWWKTTWSTSTHYGVKKSWLDWKQYQFFELRHFIKYTDQSRVSTVFFVIIKLK